MPDRSSKRPRDANQLAKLVVDVATGNAPERASGRVKDPAAVSLGRKGGLKGGAARAVTLTSEQRIAIAKNAAQARWKEKSEHD